MTSNSIEYLLFTNKQDLTCDFIIQELKNRNLDYIRLNTEDIPEISFTQIFEGGGSEIRLDERPVILANIVSAYFRRPNTPQMQNQELSESSKAYCIDEWSYLLRSIYLELDQKWFSHPNKIILAEDKPKQLRLAQKLGFNVPNWVVTNSKKDVAFLFKLGPVIAKPFRHALIKEGQNESIIFTSTIQSFEAICSKELQLAPVIFQRKIIKDCDLRVTVVDDSIFAVKIDSQLFPETETDWRHTSVEKLDHQIVDLETNLSQKCISIVKSLGLRYGAIDLVLDKNGTYWFLECNPNGQWAWIENRTGLPIAAAIVDSMEGMRIV